MNTYSLNKENVKSLLIDDAFYRILDVGKLVDDISEEDEKKLLKIALDIEEIRRTYDNTFAN